MARSQIRGGLEENARSVALPEAWLLRARMPRQPWPPRSDRAACGAPFFRPAGHGSW